MCVYIDQGVIELNTNNILNHFPYNYNRQWFMNEHGELLYELRLTHLGKS